MAIFLFATALVGSTNDANAPLQIQVLSEASVCDRRAQEGDVLTCHYTGVTLVGGVKFDSSLDRGEALVFTLGQERVVKGWDQGLVGMCVGEQRRLTIPSGVGFGSKGLEPHVKGGDTVVYDIALSAIGRDVVADADAGAAAEEGGDRREL
mgnify:CR=1 FL=1